MSQSSGLPQAPLVLQPPLPSSVFERSWRMPQSSQLPLREDAAPRGCDVLSPPPRSSLRRAHRPEEWEDVTVLQSLPPPKNYAAVLQNLLFLRGVGGPSSPPKTGDCDSEDAAPTLSSRPTPEKERRGQYFPEDVQIQRMAILCGVLRLLSRGAMSSTCTATRLEGAPGGVPDE